MNLFDSLQTGAFKVVTTTMGFDASWLPDNASVPLIARVLFNDPTDDKEKISEQQYISLNPQVEYQDGDLPGLYEAVQASNGGQTITINGLPYKTLTAKKKYDGKTIMLDVILAES